MSSGAVRREWLRVTLAHGRSDADRMYLYLEYACVWVGVYI